RIDIVAARGAIAVSCGFPMILNVSVTRGSMKSELLGSERLKIESRKLPVRRNMSKGISLVNGVADHAVVDGDSMVRQVNLVAAFHDHISCTKSADYIGDSGQEKMTLPCETDHLYANCGESTKSADDMDVERLRAIVLLHTDLIQHQQEQIFKKDRQMRQLRAERDTVR
ncbi:unnamed protein product, partial [Ixodes pacificus]